MSRSQRERQEIRDFNLIASVCRDKAKEYFNSKLALEWYIHMNPRRMGYLNQINEYVDEVFGNFDKYLKELKDEENI